MLDSDIIRILLYLVDLAYRDDTINSREYTNIRDFLYDLWLEWWVTMENHLKTVQLLYDLITIAYYQGNITGEEYKSLIFLFNSIKYEEGE